MKIFPLNSYTEIFLKDNKLLLLGKLEKAIIFSYGNSFTITNDECLIRLVYVHCVVPKKELFDYSLFNCDNKMLYYETE